MGAVAEPVLAALLLGKAAQAHERGVELVLAEDSLIDDGALPRSLAPRDLVTILGNLIDNAVDAASETATGDAGGSVPAQRTPARALVTVTARTESGELLLRVADTGAGIGPDDADEVFRRGWTTHGTGAASARRSCGRRSTATAGR